MKINDTKSFGAFIKSRRKKLGYTQKYVSDATGISTSFISDIENGKSTIELGKAIFLIHMLGIDMELNERG